MPPSAAREADTESGANTARLTPPPGYKQRLKLNRLWRLGFFFVGIVLFYAPFAVVARVVGALAPGSAAGTGVGDVHTMCLRMPLGWLVQPWMWGFLDTNPMYWVPIAVLPIAALAAGPLFCGWLCPAGSLPEFLSRLVPDRFKFDFKGKVDIVPVRYGFFVGILFVPFIAASVCCSFCNFTWMQNIVSALTGNFTSWTYFATTGFITMLLWIPLLGMLTVGGRGWCLFLCPAGSFQSLVSGLSARFGFLARVHHDASSCSGCTNCEAICPVRAIDADKLPAVEPDAASAADVRVNQYLCNVCLDCVRACPSKSLRYGRRA